MVASGQGWEWDKERVSYKLLSGIGFLTDISPCMHLCFSCCLLVGPTTQRHICYSHSLKEFVNLQELVTQNSVQNLRHNK